MSDMQRRQTTDAVNASSFGTNQLSPSQGEFLKAPTIQDGGASGKATKEPDDKVGAR